MLINTQKEKLKAIIVDVDRTLTLGPQKHRTIYEFEKSHLDAENEHICCLVRSLSFSYPILIVTGRTEKHREKTESWLIDHTILYSNIFMRPDGCLDRNPEVKQSLFFKYISPKFNVILALDDEKDVVRMWESLDIHALHVTNVERNYVSN